MKIRFFVLAVIIPFILNCGGGSSDISTVKNGTYGADRSVTVGNAFDGYKLFTKKEWKSLSDPQKRRIVEFTGTLNMSPILNRYKEWGEKYKDRGKYNTDKDTYENLLKVVNGANECIYYAQFFIAQDGKSFSLNQSGIRFSLKDGKTHEGKFWEFEADSALSEIYKNNELAFGENVYFKSPYFDRSL